MPQVVETNEEGVLTLTRDLLGGAEPRTRYVVELQGEVLVLRPDRPQPFWKGATPQQRVEAWKNWPASHPEGVGLPDEALRRESMYE